MVFGDAITVNNDDDVEREEVDGATISGSTDPETHNPETCCGRAGAAADEGRHGTDSSADAAGQRVGERHRRGSLALDTWKCAVHRHRTGLRGEPPRRAADSGGVEADLLSDAAAADDDWDPGGRRNAGTEPEAVHDDDDERRMLLDIMNVADRALRLDALRRYLAADASDRRRPAGPESAADGKDRLTTNAAQNVGHKETAATDVCRHGRATTDECPRCWCTNGSHQRGA